jgi:hypothetical protein
MEKEGKKIREAVKWISEMCLEHPERKRTSFILEAESRFNLSPKEGEFLLQKLQSGENQ